MTANHVVRLKKSLIARKVFDEAVEKGEFKTNCTKLNCLFAREMFNLSREIWMIGIELLHKRNV
jgi:hypothetical protein